MDIFHTTPLPSSYSVDNIGEPKYTQLWEVVLVAASPVVLVFCLCFCIVCLVFRKHGTAEAVPIIAENTREREGAVRRTAIANLLRNLPPPPKYDIAVSTSSTPPMYTDVEKNIIFDPVTAISAARRAASQRTTEIPCSLSIQYLYPPKYETQSQSPVHIRSTPPSPPAYNCETINEEDEDLPSYSRTEIPIPIPIVA